MNLEKTKSAARAVAAKTPGDFALAAAVKQAKAIADGAFEEAAKTDSVESFPVETLRRIADAQLLSAPLPENFGGINLGTASGTNHALLQILKHCGRGNLVVGRVFEGHFNALLLIRLFGSNEQLESCAADAETASFSAFGTRKPATA